MVYLLTFNCYGTRLPGDERGWVERARGDQRGGFHDPNPGLNQYCRETMKQQPYELDLPRARIVLEAIREVCSYRGWNLIAAHVRTNHVHVIVYGLQNVDRAIVDLKSYSSRALTRNGYDVNDRQRWARGASTRPLSTPGAVSSAITYVIDQQGEPMALTLPSVQIRQEAGQQADRRQKRADLVDEVNAAPVG